MTSRKMWYIPDILMTSGIVKEDINLWKCVITPCTWRPSVQMLLIWWSVAQSQMTANQGQHDTVPKSMFSLQASKVTAKCCKMLCSAAALTTFNQFFFAIFHKTYQCADINFSTCQYSAIILSAFFNLQITSGKILWVSIYLKGFQVFFQRQPRHKSTK